jgi:putative membrane protein
MQQWLSWQVDSDLLTLLLVFWGSYAACWGWLRRNGSQIASVGRLICWTSGLLVISIALMSSIDTMAYSLFSVHMFQHVLLMAVAPPLLILGRPLSMWRVAFVRKTAKPTTRTYSLRDSLAAIFGFILRPPVAWALSTTILLVWHVPWLYDYALNHPSVHEYAEHTTLFLTFLAWWHPLIGSLPRFPYLATSKSRFLYLLAGMVPLVSLGIVILLAPDVIYTYYLNIPPVDSISTLLDQQIGAGVMLASGMVVLFSMALPLQYVDSVPLSYP